MESYISGKNDKAPFNDKNIVFVRLSDDYSIELKNTGDVNYAFSAYNNDIFVCVADNYIKAFDVNNGKELWNIKPPENTGFGAKGLYESMSTDGNKIILDLYPKDKIGYDRVQLMVVDINKGTGKELKCSGSYSYISEYDDNKTITVNLENDYKYSAKNFTIFGDKYLIDVNNTILDEDGKIIEHVELDVMHGDKIYALNNGLLVKLIGDTYSILDNNLTEINSFKKDDNLKKYVKNKVGEVIAFTIEDKTFSHLVNEGITLDNEGNVLPCCEMPDYYDFSEYYDTKYLEYKLVKENANKEDFTPIIMNLYTGKKLENYSLVTKDFITDVIHVKDEKGKEYFLNSNFDKIYEIPNTDSISDFISDENSKYMAFQTKNDEIYVINKENNEAKKIKDANENLQDGLLINGDSVMYILSKSNGYELYAYNMKTGEEEVIFSTDKDNEEIRFSYGAHQNDWFYVNKINSTKTSDRDCDVYKLK